MSDQERLGLTLQNLSNELATVVSKYFPIGIQLGVPDHQIKVFESSYNSDASRCFSEVISYWLKNVKAVSWDSIVTALESQSVNEKTLASELSEKYLPLSSAKTQETTESKSSSKIASGRSNCKGLLVHTTVSKEAQESYVGVVRELCDKLHLSKESDQDSTRFDVTDCWTINDLHHVLNMTWDAREKWYCIGLGLGLNAENLDHIKNNNSGNVDECFIETMKVWLNRGVNTDSKSLSEALRQRMVNHIKLADSINTLEGQIGETTHSPTQLESTADGQEFFPHLPFYNLGLNAQEITKLIVQLNDDAERIGTDFSRLVLKIIMSFKTRGLPPQDFASYVIHIGSLFDDDSATDTITAAESIDKIMIELRKRKYVTLFNYHLLENVIDDLGTDSEKKCFQTYFHSFKEYCERSLFEVPQFLYDKTSANRIKFALKVSDKFKGYFQSTQASNVVEDTEGTTSISQDVKISSTTLGLSVNNTIDILRKFAKILDRDVGSFCIVDAKQGCTKIVISVLKSVAENIFSKTESNPGIAELKSSGIHVVCGPPGKPEAVDVTTTSITLTWTKPDLDIGGIINYIIFFRPASMPVKEWKRIQTIGHEEKITVYDLPQTALSFIFKVCAFGDFGEGVESEESKEIALITPVTPGDSDSTHKESDNDEPELQESYEKVNFERQISNEDKVSLLNACKEGNFDKVQELTRNVNLMNLKWKHNWTPLHEACSQGHINIAEYLIKELKLDPNHRDRDGWTPLHLACKQASGNQTTMVTFLLHHAQSDPNSITRKGETPLDVASKPEIIRLLLRNGAKPDSCFPSYLQSFPTDRIIKMYVLGNYNAGKSTLIEAISTRGNLFSRFMHLFIKVKGIDGRTAGIIPIDIDSNDLGRLTMYDFAGHKEHYLGQTFLSCRSIIIIVIDMRATEGIIRETLHYWLQLIDHRVHSIIVTEGSHKPHLFIIDSHADKISKSNKNLKLKFIQSVISSYKLDNIKFQHILTMDCRYSESFSMFKLRSILSQSCKTLRDSEEMDAAHHSFLIFLREKFKDRDAVKLDDVVAELRNNVDNDEYIYLECLKSFDPFKMCETLNEWGSFHFIGNHEDPQNSWIVNRPIQQATLSYVHILLAPKTVSLNFGNLTTNTGVTSPSMLAPLFPKVDVNMIIQLFCHLEFCCEIRNSDILRESYSFLNTSTFERLYFFPGLVYSKRPDKYITKSKFNIEYSSGWMLQCSRPEQYFSSRFLQTLLLRLAFTYTLPRPESESINDSAFTLQGHGECRLWMNGICWTTPFGCEAIVEVINLKHVVVIVRCMTKSMVLLKFVQLRSAIIKQVWNAKEEFCQKITVIESFIFPKDATSYPIELNMTSINITDIVDCVVRGTEFVVTADGRKAISLQELLYFEPYFNLGNLVLKELYNEDESQNQEITNELLFHIAEHAYKHNVIDEYCAIFEKTPLQIQTYAEKNPQDRASIHILTLKFQQWRDEMGKKGTLKEFKQKLDQFSVLSGRNPFKLNSVGGCPTGPVYHTYYSMDAEPMLHHLQLLEGYGRSVRLLDNVAPRWTVLAESLGFNKSRIMAIEEHHKESMEEACQEMFIRWLVGEPDLAQPCTWGTLIRCLRQAGFSDIADSVSMILENT